MKPRRRPVSSRRGFVVLAIVFLLASVRVAVLAWRDHAPERITLRFAHWQLESGIRDAFDALARDYEAQHPGVRIEQMLIPESIYRTWATATVIGGESPDLVQIGKGILGADCYRYFLPITAETNRPNPYNAGTPLAAVPWRNTFIDGMEGTFTPETLECYGASLFASTTRIYYNVDLMREITGQEEPPHSFAEMLELCRRVRAFAARTGRDLQPLAGSRSNGPMMMDEFISSQLQRLACDCSSGTGFPGDVNDVSGLYLGYLTRQWTLEHPALRDAFELIRLSGAGLPPGFMQFGREDAMFYFVQKRALMVMAFSQDSSGILQQATFPVRVFRNPLPEPDTPRFGANLVGSTSDRAVGTYGYFGIARGSRHADVALDFLKFLTSQPGDRKFAEVAGTLPVVVGVQPTGLLRDFLPDVRGFPPAPSLFLGVETRRVLTQSLHRLVGPDASTRAFVDDLAPELEGAIRRDLTKGVRGQRNLAAALDVTIEAARHAALRAPHDAELAEKLQNLIESQNDLEASLNFVALRLEQTSRPR